MWQAQEFIRRIGTVLRVRDDDLTHEPLPERWVDLIHYLEDKGRRESGIGHASKLKAQLGARTRERADRNDDLANAWRDLKGPPSVASR